MKRLVGLLLAFVMLVPLFTANAEEALPISAEPLTLTAWFMDINGDCADLNDRAIWDYVEEKTNIRLDITVFSVTQQEALNLRMTTLDEALPDIIMRHGIPDNLIYDAFEGGFILELTDELLQQYAPFWASFLAEHPDSDFRIQGKRVEVLEINHDASVGNLRDQLFINKVWLDELGLQVPTTTTELKNVLQAFKDNAGKGSIPAEAFPFYYQWDQHITGPFDVLAFWGVPTRRNHWLAVEDGKVIYQGVNPAIKEPIKYLAELYKLNLTPAESFTDDRQTSIARTKSETPYIGFFANYNNTNAAVYIPIAPMDTETGIRPIMRKQEFSYTTSRYFMLTNSNQHVAESLRLIDWLSTDVEALTNMAYGMRGVHWDYDENGMVQPYTNEELEAVKAKLGEEEYIRQGSGELPTIKADYYYSHYHDVLADDPTSRQWAYQNIYKNYVWEGYNYVEASTGDADLDQRRKDLATELNNLRTTTLAGWITGQVDIDAEWDAYVEQMNKLGLQEYLELCQRGYDTLGWE